MEYRTNIAARAGATAAALLVGVAIVAGPAQEARADPSKDADEAETAPPGTILAPKDAVELQFDAGYTQPFGRVSESLPVTDLAHAGFVGGGALAIRVSPRFAIAGYGGFHHSVADDSLDGGMVFGGAAGLAANLHLRPYALVDPYFVAGSGYRLLFVAPGSTADNHMFHGFEVLKANFGVDFRVSNSFAIGPTLGADVNLLVWDLNESTGESRAIDKPGVSTFLFTGVAGKFDVLGTRVTEHQERAAMR